MIDVCPTSNQIIVKLTDFGLACYYNRDDPPSNLCGTLNLMAPEILENKKYCPKVDCFALGFILFMLLTGKLPFTDGENYVIKD